MYIVFVSHFVLGQDVETDCVGSWSLPSHLLLLHLPFFLPIDLSVPILWMSPRAADQKGVTGII